MSIVVRSLPGTFKLEVVDGVVCQYHHSRKLKNLPALKLGRIYQTLREPGGAQTGLPLLWQLWHYWPTRIWLLEAESVRAVQFELPVTTSPVAETLSANDKTRADLDSDPK
jgi:hypothetical protein